MQKAGLGRLFLKRGAAFRWFVQRLVDFSVKMQKESRWVLCGVLNSGSCSLVFSAFSHALRQLPHRAQGFSVSALLLTVVSSYAKVYPAHPGVTKKEVPS
jgi:hypothetical protein